MLCFSGLWQDLSLAACGIPSTAPKTSFWSNCVLSGAVVGSVIGFLWNSVHSPENELLQQLFAFRGCGKIWQARFVLIAMTADRTRSRTRTGPDPTRTRAPDPTRTGRTLTMTVATFRRFFLNFQTQRPQWWKLTIQLLSGGGRVKQLDTLRVGHLQWITEHNGDYSPNSYCSRNSYSNWEMLINHHILGTCYFQTNPYTYNMVSQVQVGL